jgi:nicotinamide-nucleotide amidase
MNDDRSADGAVSTAAGEEAAAAVVASAAGRSIATAESCTAGRIAAALASAEGAGESFRGGLVAYQETVKRALLGVTAPTIFCERVGDEVVEGFEPGTIFVATIVDGATRATTVVTTGDPSERGDRAALAALCLLRDHLRDVSG